MAFRPRALLFVLPLLLGSVLLAACGSSQPATPAVDDPSVVAVIDERPLTLGTFETRYARSVGGRLEAADDSLEAYHDFLERYVDFRLKVLAAQEAGYGTDSTILAEIQGYRTSFAKPYLLDKEVINPIVRELYERSAMMVDASHILLRVAPDAPPADTLAAYAQIAGLRDSVRAGADFATLATFYSQDPSAQREGAPGYQGRLGYFTAGRMVEPFETAAYETPVGDVSDIERTRFGYHIVYVHDRQPAVQPIRVSHILIRPDGATDADTAFARQRVDSLRAQLMDGADFAALARANSADARSGAQGGDLGWIRFDNYNLVAPFREAAFELEEIGDVSEVVETQFGYHLIQLTDREERGTLEAEYDDLKQLASRLPRSAQAEQELKESILAERGATLDTTAALAVFVGRPADSVLVALSAGTYDPGLAGTPIATLGDSVYTWADWTTFAKTASVPQAETTEAQVLLAADRFLQEQALAYEAAALEERDDEFRLIMEEFRDGLMLFKLMEDRVWTAAAQDSAGLQAYYEANRETYRFPDRTRAVSLISTDDSLLTATVARLDAGFTFAELADELAADSSLDLRVDTVMVDQPSQSLYDTALSLPEGGHTQPLQDRSRFVVVYNAGVEPSRLKTFDEARSQVVAAYQDVLEDELIAELRARYDVVTYPQRLTAAFQDVPEASMTPTAGTQ